MNRLSILIPMRNAEAFVADTLRSIATGQSLDPSRDEIVIIDDGSTDRSRHVAEHTASTLQAAVRIIAGPRKGISAAMNAGLASASGRWICRCDADDLYPPGRLTRQMDWLESHPDFGAVCGSFSMIDARGRALSDLDCGAEPREITDELLTGATRTHLCTFLASADALRQAGGFREWFVTAEDIDVQLRLAQVCRVYYEPAPAYRYRLHDSSITHQQADAKRAFYEATARAFAAQRRDRGADDLQLGAPPTPPVALRPRDEKPNSTGRQAQQILIGASWRQHKAGQKRQAVATGLRACLARPTNLSAWKSLGTLLLKRPGNGPAPTS